MSGNLRPWKKGESGNPKGRPIGSRQKIAEAMLKDLQAIWKTHGRQALDRLAQEDPGKFAQIAFGILPRDILLQIDSQQTVTIQEIKRVVIEPGHFGRPAVAPEPPRLLEHKPLPAEAPAEDQQRMARILELMKRHVPTDAEGDALDAMEAALMQKFNAIESK
jgi:hypothetical protein